MKKWITTKNITTCSLLSAVMFVMGAAISTIASMTGKSIIQFSDIIFLIMLGKTNLFTLILSAIIAGSMIDLYAGGAIFIPITILVKILIGLTYLLLRKKVNIHIIFIISYLWIFIYNLYTYILWDASTLIVESIVNLIQYSVTVVFSIAIVFVSNFKLQNNILKNDYNDTVEVTINNKNN
ncbi:hypothetical protein [Spiroplasma turonicum]|uniref:Transmembrane protein n=1 Tax=Spiroplasma turonicum TaxID=216946 RepID=A0A0K1P5K3_9MOLU|nr:hypothetical protein [Spiroplasma turonicum]AKU79573.1 hypothetical protein STURON_00327 [Spiroplasma turonicum]ALX70596.1 hypothetical protein STURO_v1c03280 [Spiroplasma turonicum]